MASLLSHLPLIPIPQHLIILLILIQMPPYLSSYVDYRGCTNLISCGGITKIGFPFWGENRPKECGHPLMHLICQNDISYITIKGVRYKVLEANPDEHTLNITRVDYLQEGLCPSKLVNTSLDTDLFVYGSDYNNLTLLYGCSTPPNYSLPFINRFRFPCNEASVDYVYPQFVSLPPMFCKASVVVPVPPPLIDNDINDVTKIHQAIVDGFVVRWIVDIEECGKCKLLGGICGIDWSSNQITCYCGVQPCSNFLPDAKAPPQSPPPGMSNIIDN